MNKHLVPTAILLAAAFLLSSCGALFPAPLATPLPPEMIGTEIVQTSAALATQTALYAPSPANTLRPSRTPRPSETPRPTYTPSITPSPTVTFVVTIPHIGGNIVPTGTGSIHYPYHPLPGYEAANGCDLTAMSPAFGSVYKKGETFNTSWTFINYGPYTWNTHEVDFIYISGEKMQAPPTTLVYDLPATILPGQKVTIKIPMKAPSSAGTFSTAWRLHEGDRFYCQVTMQIGVK
jgi:hypothetical protein